MPTPADFAAACATQLGPRKPLLRQLCAFTCHGCAVTLTPAPPPVVTSPPPPPPPPDPHTCRGCLMLPPPLHPPPPGATCDGRARLSVAAIHHELGEVNTFNSPASC